MLILVVIAIIVFISYEDVNPEPTESVDDYSGFTIKLNCSLPTPPSEINIISVGKGNTTQEELVTLATELFQMNDVNVTIEDEALLLTSGEKTLRYFPTDYIKYRDRSINRDKVVPVNETALLKQAEVFLEALNEYYPLLYGDELRFERTEYPDYTRTDAGEYVSTQPQYIVYYHSLNGTLVLALNAEFNLGFADGKITYADISRINIVGSETTEITKSPVHAILEAFPGAEFKSGIGVSSSVLVPVRGTIIIENFRLMHYNWHGPNSKPVGEPYGLYPYYKFDALLVGPDKFGVTRSVRVNREIEAY